MKSNQTAMRQLLNQLREERDALTMDAEWNRCFQAIEMIIQTKFLPLERNQIMIAHYAGESPRIIHNNSIDYYTSTYE